MSSRAEIAASICTAARHAYQRGLQTGNGGNLSARLPGGRRLLITSSGASLADCTPETLVEVDLDSGEPVAGRPSSELHSHVEIYRHRPDVGAIFHCHAPWSIACAEAGDTLPAIARHAMQKIGVVPILRTGADPSPSEVAAAIGRLLGERPGLQAFIEAQHGIFSLGASMELATYGAELVEETAQVAVLAALLRTAGKGQP